MDGNLDSGDLSWIQEVEKHLKPEIKFMEYCISLYTASYEQDQTFTLLQIRDQWREFYRGMGRSPDVIAAKVKESQASWTSLLFYDLENHFLHSGKAPPFSFTNGLIERIQNNGVKLYTDGSLLEMKWMYDFRLGL
ncbi:hypothetical protein MMC18_002561 [Xylographa bjoerkii]|nr:hypothetical protein [Xylographa bjoerkii]